MLALFSCAIGWGLPYKRPFSARDGLVVCVLWYLFFPMVLVAYLVRSLAVPRLWVRVPGRQLCCCCGGRLGKCTDRTFPPDSTSIGPAISQGTEWCRASRIFGGRVGGRGEYQPLVLVGEGLGPAVLAKGQSGERWLLGAIVCLAEYPQDSQAVFISAETNPCGVYVCRMYNGYTGPGRIRAR